MMSTFLTLPYEIRHEIYLQLLTTERGIDPLLRILSPADARLNLHLPIIRACRSTYQEGMRVLLNHNHFVYQTDANFWYCKQYSLFHFYFTAMSGPPYEHLFKNEMPILPYLHLIQHLDFRIGGLLDAHNLRKILRHLSAANLTLRTISIETWGAWHQLWIQRMLKALERITVSRHVIITANEREFIIGYDRMDAFWNTNISQFEEELALWGGNGYYALFQGDLKTFEEPVDESGNGDVHTMREWVLKPCEEILDACIPVLMAQCGERDL